MLPGYLKAVSSLNILLRFYRLSVLSVCFLSALFFSNSSIAVPWKSEVLDGNDQQGMVALYIQQAETYQRQAEQFLLNGERERASQYFRSAGAIYTLVGQRKDAIKRFERYFELVDLEQSSVARENLVILVNFVDILITYARFDDARIYQAQLEKLMQRESRNDSRYVTASGLFQAQLAMADGNRQRFLEKLDEVHRHLLKIKTVEPEFYADGYQKLLLATLRTGEIEKALEFYREDFRVNQELYAKQPLLRVRALQGEAQFLTLLGRREEYIDRMQAVLIEPDLPAPMKFFILSSLGDVSMDLKDYRSAIRYYEEVDNYPDKNVAGVIDASVLGYAHAKIGNRAAAQPYLERAELEYSQLPQNLSAWLRLNRATFLALLNVELDRIERGRALNQEARDAAARLNVFGSMDLLVYYQLQLKIAEKSDVLEDWIDAESGIYPVITGGLSNRNAQIFFTPDLTALLMTGYQRLVASDPSRYQPRAFSATRALLSTRMDQAMIQAYERSAVANVEFQKAYHRRSFLQQMLSQPGTDLDTAGVLREQIRLLDLDLRGYPEYQQLTLTDASWDASEYQKRLGTDEALIVFVRGHRSYLAWLLDSERVELVDLAVEPENLERWVARLRGGLVMSATGELPAFDSEAAAAVWKALFEPMQERLQRYKKLLVVPDQLTMKIPFSALVYHDEYGSGWLADRFQVSLLPSMAVLGLKHAAEEQVHARRFLGVGNPLLDFARDHPASALQALPETEQELRLIAESFGSTTSDLLLGAEATEERLRATGMASYEFIAFATHNLFGAEDDVRQEPALLLSPPEKVESNDDGLLSVSEIMSMPVNARLVVLSACDTSGAAGSSAHEGLAGLVQGFQFSGARSLLVSNWAVESRSAARITTSVVSAMVNHRQSPSEALQYTMSRMAAGEFGGTWTHPFYWAPFVVIGRP